MYIEHLMTRIREWMKAKLTGVVTIYFHEGGIRKVKLETEIK